MPRREQQIITKLERTLSAVWNAIENGHVDKDFFTLRARVRKIMLRDILTTQDPPPMRKPEQVACEKCDTYRAVLGDVLELALLDYPDGDPIHEVLEQVREVLKDTPTHA